MLEAVMFFEAVRQAAAGLDAVDQVEIGEDLDQLELRVLDTLPGGDAQPWIVRVRRNERFVHPLWGERYACIELSVAFLAVDPALPTYLSVIGATAGPCLEHQRFCSGASVTWEPDTGQIAIYGQVRLRDQPQAVFVAQLRDCLRDVVALLYLVSFRIWQLQLRRQMSGPASAPIIEAAWKRMIERLGASLPATP